ncbi:PstS family phosphate ABC transporter substrate-binding protein [Xylanibacter muris]|uniref:Phosphate-binding protein n=1 Tax=Xylanibacter muris TaxID=2736290 RepID=A0ABX2AN46_9BACT|nr:substrate-binding domain-containing protein [Xylanibacter muris]NPD91967.1 phosphate-binding protein [Xylanibacter muris]
MKKRIFSITVGLTIVLGLLLSCSDKPKNGRTDTYSSGTIKFTADESFSPIIDECVEVFESIYPQAKLNAEYTNELDAVNMLMKEKVWLAITSRRFTDAELQNLKERKFMPVAIPIAYDGLAIIVNNSNPDSCITVKDFARILSGKAKKWKDVYPNSSMGDIDVVFDNAKSSTVHYCVDSILGGVPINSPNIEAVKKSAEVVDYVSKHKNSIGIIGSNWLNDKRDTTNVTFNKEIKVMAVSKMDSAVASNSWKPYQYYLYNRNYPLVRTIYALLNDPLHRLPWGFTGFITSPQGQMIIFKSALLPVRGNLTVREVNVSSE